jgi:hypothetical protein
VIELDADGPRTDRAGPGGVMAASPDRYDAFAAEVVSVAPARARRT